MDDNRGVESWLRDIEGARNEAEVVRHARDYCSLLNPRDLAPLESGLTQVRIETGADIAATRDKLARGWVGVRAHEEEVRMLRDLMAVLARAAERLAELRGAPR